MIYNRIIIGDIFDVLPNLRKFDVAIVSDVIEHFSKEKGLKLIRELFCHVDNVIISTPFGFFPKTSGSITINSHERHLSGWYPKDFQQFNIVESVKVPRIRKNKFNILIMYLTKYAKKRRTI